MNNLDKQYTDLLQDILDNGVTKRDRTGTGTLSVFGRQIRHKMSDGFPLLTTKKMPFKTITTELLWFLRGDTNIKYLVDNNCHIWDGDAYKNYEKITNDFQLENPIDDFIIKTLRGEMIKFETEDGDDYRTLTQEEFINKIKTDDEFAKKWGDLGPIYGKQWRNWSNYRRAGSVDEVWSDYRKQDPIDQIETLIEQLKTDPDSRRLMVNAWNVGELDSMVLPPCHYGFQVYTRELSEQERWEIANLTPNMSEFDYCNKLCDEYNVPKRAISLMWNQRSVDTFLGLPFNIASYGLLLEIIAKEVNMIPDELIGNLGDTHLYLNHIEQAKEQIGGEFTIQVENEAYPELKEIREKKKEAIYNQHYASAAAYRDKEKTLLSSLPERRTREPFPLPKLIICGDMRRTDGFTVPFDELDHSLIKLIDYQAHPSIKAPLSN
jgi:thymidylate synthase